MPQVKMDMARPRSWGGNMSDIMPEQSGEKPASLWCVRQKGDQSLVLCSQTRLRTASNQGGQMTEQFQGLTDQSDLRSSNLILAQVFLTGASLTLAKMNQALIREDPLTRSRVPVPLAQSPMTGSSRPELP